MVLQAAYCDPNLHNLIDANELHQLIKKTIGFLEFFAYPSSALWIDLKILRHMALKTGLLMRDTADRADGGNADDVPAARPLGRSRRRRRG